jgi:hypothetical protein
MNVKFERSLMMRKLYGTLVTGGMLTALAVFPNCASAAILQGNFSITGSLIFSQGFVDFTLPQNTSAAPGNGAFSVSTTPADQTGGFTGLTGTAGTILDLVNTAAPAGASVNLGSFLTFAGAPNITVTLNKILFGDFPPGAACAVAPAAGGQICTPPSPPPVGGLSIFDLHNLTATSSEASFSVQGTEVDSLTGNTVAVTGLFTAQFQSNSFQSLLAIVAAGGSVPTSFSAGFVTIAPVPEPSNGLTFLIGAGLLLIGSVVAKKIRRA